MPTPPSFSLIDEDDKVSPRDGDLRPRKNEVVDVGGGVPLVVDLVEGEFMLRETVTIYIGDDVGVTSNAPQLEEADEGVPLRPDEEMVVGRTLNTASCPQGKKRPHLLGRQGQMKGHY